MTETWLNNTICDAELFDSRYTVYRRDRQSSGFYAKKDGGGVLIAVSNKFYSSRCNSESQCEDLYVKVEISHRNYLFFCAVYLPPPLNKNILEHFLDNFNHVSEGMENICLIGDLNMSCISWPDCTDNDTCIPI